MAETTDARSDPFEAAVRAGFGRCDDYPCGGVPCSCEQNRDRTRRILAAALPPDPAPEAERQVELMAEAMRSVIGRKAIYRDDLEVARAARRALRASLLPGEEPS